MKFEEFLIEGISKVKDYEIFKNYATDDRIYALWSQFLYEHSKLMQGRGNNAYSCIRATLILLSLTDKDINLCDTINEAQYKSISDEEEFIKIYLKSLVNIKGESHKRCAIKNICSIAYATIDHDQKKGKDVLEDFKFDIFEDFKTVLLAEELEYGKVVKGELLNAMLYYDEFNEIYNYDTSIILGMMEDVIDDCMVSFEKYADYIVTELHEEAHNVLEKYLEDCDISYNNDTLV